MAFERDEYHELCIHFTLQNRRPSGCCSHFSETPGINLQRISGLHCPVILYLKVAEAAADVIH